VPAYRPQDDVTLKMPAFEWIHALLRQQNKALSLSPPDFCNSAKKFTQAAQSLITRVHLYYPHISTRLKRLKNKDHLRFQSLFGLPKK
ncbi:hypothetical protein, partial [Escherichia coli]|uniref:hypothetical protein n=1 Tax=Enterobacteriaceae TaxID=543 RepID=UPI0019CF6344|nr:hypothetical protein [Escherichia coli]MBO2076884.1 hypothetical protein [Salmonella sp. 32020501-2019-00050]